MTEYIPYDSIEQADQRSADWWASVRGPGWKPENITQYLYGRLERVDDPLEPSPLPDGVDYAIRITARDDDLDSLIVADEMLAQEAGAVSDLYPAWAMGATYAVDDLVSYEDALWKCRQAHTAVDAAWYPPNVPALWLRYRKDADTLLEWVAGEQVYVGWQRTYDGGTYECIQAHVTQSDWTPPAVPALWSVVTEPTDEWQA